MDSYMYCNCGSEHAVLLLIYVLTYMEVRKRSILWDVGLRQLESIQQADLVHVYISFTETAEARAVVSCL